MRPAAASHEWIIAPFRSDRHAAPRDTRDEWHEIDAHRNLRGPYTAAGGLVRRLAARTSALAPDLLREHQLTLLVVAPEFGNHLPASDELAKLLTFSGEGNSRSRTLRLAHGLTDFLLGYVARVSTSRLSVSFENVDLADPLDREFLSVLLRRADPERLMVRVCGSSDLTLDRPSDPVPNPAPEPADDPLRAALKMYARTIYMDPAMPPAAAAIPEIWRSWLRQCTSGWSGEWTTLSDLSEYHDLPANHPPSCTLSEFVGDVVERMSPAERKKLAAGYVASDCVSDSLVGRRAYAAIPASDRKILHLERAADLEALNEDSLSLGAIPFHHEQAEESPAPLLAASKRCMHLAFYEATLDWAQRGQRMLSKTDRGKTYGEFGRNILFARMLLGRFDEVEAACAENLALSDDPALLAHTAYAKAILAARLYEPSRRDYDAAKSWIEKSRAFTEKLPPSETRAVNLAFLRNTRALVEMRKGRLEAAHELLSGALDYLAKEAPGKYEAESAILLHNRARLHIARKQSDGAVGDLTTLLRHQPCNTEAYFDRGLLHQRAGRYEEALQDYDDAIRWSPPYPEAFFNRAQVLAALGRPDEALTGYTRVLVLAPGHVEALLNRAYLFYERLEFAASRADVDAALAINPKHAKLLCLRGLLEMKEGRFDDALEKFTQAIGVDSSLADAWANRATILFKRGDLDGASSDLTNALNLREDSAALYNRGRVFEAQEKWTEAIADFSRALQLANGDAQHIQRHLTRCQQAVAPA